ncbi:response regulator transcription factor [Terriglobus albidus]|uniref:Response regulator transcription factor n=1 Tax=Terriglobus albidus TaxID=1592106 RepID=A0A5B9E5I1_9BACT|nr:LytTR family DNA-binding domain-containing protein [Terriglobus albidus]QEE27258.1 response regulator transcription factor [Terriglobus albidus]
MSLRTLIVDDEPLAVELLGLLLSEHEDIEVVAQCGNGSEAVRYLQSTPIDLLFLDVEMPKMGGFDVVERIGLQQIPPTVFVTAFHEHAVRAFDIHAVDYITKPVNPERLSLALQRVREKIASRTALLTQAQLSAVLEALRNGIQEPAPYLTRFLVKVGEKEVLVPAEKIDWIEAAEYYCCLHAEGHQYMVREPISDLSNKLDPRQFLRIHRSSIVNLNRIREIYREGPFDSSVILFNGQRLKMSKTGRAKLNDLVKV